MSKPKCRHQIQSSGVYICRRSMEATGPCLGICASYESVMNHVPDILCHSCGQLKTSSETVYELELQKERLITFINDALLNGLDVGEGVTLVAEVSQ